MTPSARELLLQRLAALRERHERAQRRAAAHRAIADDDQQPSERSDAGHGARPLEQLDAWFETPEEQQARMHAERQAIQRKQWAEAGEGTKILSVISLVVGSLWLALLFWVVGLIVALVITTRLGLPLSSSTLWLTLWALASIAIAIAVPALQHHGRIRR